MWYNEVVGFVAERLCNMRMLKIIVFLLMCWPLTAQAQVYDVVLTDGRIYSGLVTVGTDNITVLTKNNTYLIPVAWVANVKEVVTAEKPSYTPNENLLGTQRNERYGDTIIYGINGIALGIDHTHENGRIMLGICYGPNGLPRGSRWYTSTICYDTNGIPIGVRQTDEYGSTNFYSSDYYHLTGSNGSGYHTIDGSYVTSPVTNSNAGGSSYTPSNAGGASYTPVDEKPPGHAYAERDSNGNITYRDASHFTTGYAERDSNGNTTYQDASHFTTGYAERDSNGNITYRDAHHFIIGYAECDSNGNLTYRDAHHFITGYAERDSNGNITYRDAHHFIASYADVVPH